MTEYTRKKRLLIINPGDMRYLSFANYTANSDETARRTSRRNCLRQTRDEPRKQFHHLYRVIVMIHVERASERSGKILESR